MISPGEAARIAKRYQQTIPVDVFALARELGLDPVKEDLPDNVSGAIRVAPNGNWQIVVNALQSPLRQRFTVAHEIGHFIYHRNRLEQGGGTSDNLAYRTDEKYNDNPHITWLQEHQANQYASNLLIPPHHLQAAIAEGLDEEALAKRFDVSRAAMRIKMGPTPARAPKPSPPA